MGSSAPTRDQTQAPCIEHGVLALGPPWKSLQAQHGLHHLVIVCSVLYFTPNPGPSNPPPIPACSLIWLETKTQPRREVSLQIHHHKPQQAPCCCSPILLHFSRPCSHSPRWPVHTFSSFWPPGPPFSTFHWWLRENRGEIRDVWHCAISCPLSSMLRLSAFPPITIHWHSYLGSALTYQCVGFHLLSYTEMIAVSSLKHFLHLTSRILLSWFSSHLSVCSSSLWLLRLKSPGGQFLDLVPPLTAFISWF